jgi:hypothetical protein
MARVIGILVLLLIAATPSPSHQPEAPETHTSANQPHSSPSPVPRLSEQGSSKGTPNTGHRYAYNHYYPATISESPPVWFQVGTTVILLFFTGGLWVTSISQWRAIKDQARIANTTTAVMVAQDRPYLLAFSGWVKELTMPIVFDKEGASHISGISCDLHNYGKGPAIITEIRAKLIYAIPDFPSPPRFNDCVPQPLGQKVIPPNEQTNFIVRMRQFNAGADMFDDKRPERLYCYGVILYIDLHGTTSWTTFGFQRDFLRGANEAIPGWMWVMGPKEYNQIGIGCVSGKEKQQKS